MTTWKMKAPVMRAVSMKYKWSWQIKFLMQSWKAAIKILQLMDYRIYMSAKMSQTGGEKTPYRLGLPRKTSCY
jgi:hypothetical protein